MKILDDITNEIMFEPMPIEADANLAVGERLAGKDKILVMDDDEPVRVTVKLVLQRIEYEVETAKDGAEAVDIYKKAREANRPFDAVIVDLTVADGMGGEETIKRLLEIDREIKAIVSNGNITGPVMNNYRKYGFRAVLPKPFRIDEMEKTLHEVIMGNMNSYCRVGIARQKHSAIANEMVGNAHPTIISSKSAEGAN